MFACKTMSNSHLSNDESMSHTRTFFFIVIICLSSSLADLSKRDDVHLFCIAQSLPVSLLWTVPGHCSVSHTQPPKHQKRTATKTKSKQNFRCWASLVDWVIGCVHFHHIHSIRIGLPIADFLCISTTNCFDFYCSFGFSRLVLACSYKNAIDGLMRVRREEGARRLFSGATTATARGFLMTIGQIAFYDQAKSVLLSSGYFQDDPRLHFVASLAAGAAATLLTQPIDVIKTRSMSAKPGEFAGVWAIVAHTAKLGPMGFFKGFVPAFVRLGPHTILTFLLLEQLRLNFGYLPAAIPNAVSKEL